MPGKYSYVRLLKLRSGVTRTSYGAVPRIWGCKGTPGSYFTCQLCTFSLGSERQAGFFIIIFFNHHWRYYVSHLFFPWDSSLSNIWSNKYRWFEIPAAFTPSSQGLATAQYVSCSNCLDPFFFGCPCFCFFSIEITKDGDTTAMCFMQHSTLSDLIPISGL